MGLQRTGEGRANWLGIAILVAVVFVIVAVVGQLLGSGPDKPGPSGQATANVPANTVAISIASSNTKQAWLAQAVASFNAEAATNSKLQVGGQPVFVVVLQETVDGKAVDYRSGTMVSDTLAGRIEPTILSPGEESWIAKFEREWSVQKSGDPITGPSPILVRTPLVMAMWQSRAAALGCWPTAGPGCTWQEIRALAENPDGWASLGHPEWRKFRFGFGYFGESNSGTLAVLSMCAVGAGKISGLTVADIASDNECGKFVAGVERAKVHSGKSDVWLLDKMTAGGPEYLDAVVTYESNVIATNRKSGSTLREPMVSVYPQDGTVVVGHPFAILDGAPWVTDDQEQAAAIFRDYLLSGPEQRKVLELGLRPADVAVKLGSPIERGFGADPDAKLTAITVPETLVLDRLGEVWHQVRKHAAIAIVFDKSGSMGGTKITSAVKGAQEFVTRMEVPDTLLWIPFDSVVYSAVVGRKGDIGEGLVATIGGTPADGGTALYDAILSAYQQLTEIRATEGDSLRYGIVVLSDGQDQNSTITLAQLEEVLRPSEADPTGIQIHTIGIGTDADEATLQKIAAAANGRFWKPKNDTDVVVVYRDIAAYF